MQLHEIVTVAVLGLLLGGYLALVVGFGWLGATWGGAFYLSLATFVVVGLPHTPERWSYPTLLPTRAQKWLQEIRRHRNVFR